MISALLSPDTVTEHGPAQPALHEEWVRVSKGAAAELYEFLRAPHEVRALLFTPDGRMGFVQVPTQDDHLKRVWSVPTRELRPGEQPDTVVGEALQRRGSIDAIASSHPWAKYVDLETTNYALTVARPELAEEVVQGLTGASRVKFLDEMGYRGAVARGEFDDDLSMHAAIQLAFLRHNHPERAQTPFRDGLATMRLRRLLRYIRPQRGLKVEPVTLTSEQLKTKPGQMLDGAKFNGDDWLQVETIDGRAVSTHNLPTAGALAIKRDRKGRPKKVIFVGERSHAMGFDGIVTAASGGVDGELLGDGSMAYTEQNYQDAALHELRQEAGFKGIAQTLKLLVRGRRFRDADVRVQLYQVDVERGRPVKEGGDEKEFKFEKTTILGVPYKLLRDHLVWFLENVFTDAPTQLALMELIKNEEAADRGRSGHRLGRTALTQS